MNRQLISGRALAFILAVCAMRASIDFAYIYALNPIYAYQGFILEFSMLRYVLSWAFLLFALINVPHTFKNLSDFFLVISTLGYLLPMSSLYGVRVEDFWPMFVAWAAIQGTYFLAHTSALPRVVFPPIKYGETMSVGLSLAVLGAVLVWLIASGAAANFNLDLEEVYSFREAAAEVTSGSFMTYISNWGYKTFAVFLICWSLLRKYYAFTIALIMLQTVFFGLTAHKSVFFTPLAIILVWLFVRRSQYMLFLPVGFVFLINGAVIANDLGEINYLSFFVRRVLYLPSDIHFRYFEFFADNTLVWWRHLPLISSLGHPYGGIPPAEVVGEMFYGGSHTNIGYIAAGYAQGGFIGVFIYVVLVAALLKVLDSLLVRASELWYFVALTVFHLGLLLTTMDPLTALLTHGLIPLYVLLIASQRRGPQQASVMFRSTPMRPAGLK